MTLRNALCERLGIQVPVFGLAHRIEVAAAISRAGGLGVYAAARDGPDELAGKLQALRALCPDHPVGVDLLLPTALPQQHSPADVAAAVPDGHRRWVQQLAQRHGVPPATRGNFFSMYVRSQALFQEQVEAAVASGVEVFAAGVGTPPDVLARAKAAGQQTIALVGHPRRHPGRPGLRRGRPHRPDRHLQPGAANRCGGGRAAGDRRRRHRLRCAGGGVAGARRPGRLAGHAVAGHGRTCTTRRAAGPADRRSER